MRRLPIALVPVALIAFAACSSGNPAAATPPASSAAAPAVTGVPDSASPAATLGPLALGHFPPGKDGRAAKGVCEAWQGLRTQYAYNLVNDSPYQLEQWFSGPDWATARADADKVGDGAYTSLIADYTVATIGDTASVANARNVDKACAAG